MINLSILILLQCNLLPNAQERCNKAVNRRFYVFDCITDRYKTQEICGRVVFKDIFLRVYCPDRHKFIPD